MKMNSKRANWPTHLSPIEMESGLRKALREHQVDEQIASLAKAMLTSGVHEESAHELLQAEAFKALLPAVDAYIESHEIDVHPTSALGTAFGVLAVFEAESAAHSAMAQAIKQVNARDWQTYIRNSAQSVH